MSFLQAEWLPLAMGGVPYERVETAWNAILKYLAHLPGWPQMPRRAHSENMYTQFSERFPGVVLRDGRVHVARGPQMERDLDQLYIAYLENDLTWGRISPEYAAGLAALRSPEIVPLVHAPLALKGHITGPISWGLTVVDENQQPILYDELLADAVGKHLHLKAAWQEQQLLNRVPRAVTIIEEPYLASFGSEYVSLTRSQVIGLIEEVLAGLQGAKGVHSCGNIDWSVLLNTSIDILSLDAYDYGPTLAQYASDVTRFLKGGGIIAWGITPAGIAAETETVESLVNRLHTAIDLLVDKGVSRDAILEAGMITPSCRLGALTEPLAERILKLTVGVSAEMRRRYINPGEAGTPSA